MSTLKTNTIKNTDDVEMYLAKAWVNFNGTGTVAIRAAGNVSSITDVGTGNYQVNLTNALPDVNYCVVATNGDTNSYTGRNYISTGGFLTTSSFYTAIFDGSGVDQNIVQCAVFR